MSISEDRLTVQERKNHRLHDDGENVDTQTKTKHRHKVPA